MTKKQYRWCSLSIVIILSMSISISINFSNYYLPIIFMLSAMASLHYCRKQIKTPGVMADERDYKVAGDAARYTIYVYGWLGAIGTFILLAISGKSGHLYTVSQFLAFSVCFLMLFNAFLFKYLSRRGEKS